ncbi:MAG: hypothetical protein LBR75_05425 [Prevotellaceae bacterium]|jgi:hypothetical protein|nr:hypothetical protein [Prevotellaceae bacterium]
MKKILLLVALIAISSVAFSQDYKVEIEKTFNEYSALMDTKDFQKIMDYMPVEIFEIILKDLMVKNLEDAYNDTTILLEVKRPKILEIGKLEKIKGKYYSIFSSSVQMNITIKAEEKEKFDEEEKDEDNPTLKEILLAMYQKIYGKENVSYNESTQTFEIQSIQKTIAISENGISGWKFMNADKGLETLLEKILPKKILKSAL